MTKSSNLYVGMDVHRESIEIALSDEDVQQEVRHYGSIGGDLAAVDQAVRKLQATGKTLQFFYETGPCGNVIYRRRLARVWIASSWRPR
jgi:transposase